jgi:hypothetical protein
MQGSFRTSFVIAGLTMLAAGSAAHADLVVNFTSSHYHRTGLANNGLVGASFDGTPDPINQPNNGLSDDLDLSGASGMLLLAPGVPQNASISTLAFIAGITGAGTAGPYTGSNGGLDHTSDDRGAFITDQTLSINGSPAQSIAQSFTVHVGWYYDTVWLNDSPVLTFDLGDGNVVTFKALASTPVDSDGGLGEGTTYGQFLLTVVPLPPAAWAGLSTMLGIAGVGIIRRRRHTA